MALQMNGAAVPQQFLFCLFLAKAGPRKEACVQGTGASTSVETFAPFAFFPLSTPARKKRNSSSCFNFHSVCFSQKGECRSRHTCLQNCKDKNTTKMTIRGLIPNTLQVECNDNSAS